MGALTGDVFAELFPESQPVVLQTSPAVPPTSSDGESVPGRVRSPGNS